MGSLTKGAKDGYANHPDHFHGNVYQRRALHAVESVVEDRRAQSPGAGACHLEEVAGNLMSQNTECLEIKCLIIILVGNPPSVLLYT